MGKKSVYFSSLLPVRFSEFFKNLSGILDSTKVKWGLLPHTNDIWCRDYMPVRVSPRKFVQFKYAPSYLMTKKWRSTITDPVKVCEAVGIKADPWDFVIDGGNVVRFGSKAIMTERIYSENPEYYPEIFPDVLKDFLKVDELIMIPEEPWDPYGHADGCVRFLNENTVIIHELHKSHPGFDRALRNVLKKHRLEYVEMPYFIDNDPKHKDSAVGNYVNYLEAGKVIVVPAYMGYSKQNERALSVLKSVFKGKKIVQIESTPIAKLGGVLNCVSWDLGKKEW